MRTVHVRFFYNSTRTVCLTRLERALMQGKRRNDQERRRRRSLPRTRRRRRRAPGHAATTVASAPGSCRQHASAWTCPGSAATQRARNASSSPPTPAPVSRTSSAAPTCSPTSACAAAQRPTRPRPGVHLNLSWHARQLLIF